MARIVRWVIGITLVSLFAAALVEVVGNAPDWSLYQAGGLGAKVQAP